MKHIAESDKARRALVAKTTSDSLSLVKKGSELDAFKSVNEAIAKEIICDPAFFPGKKKEGTLKASFDLRPIDVGQSVSIVMLSPGEYALARPLLKVKPIKIGARSRVNGIDPAQVAHLLAAIYICHFLNTEKATTHAQRVECIKKALPVDDASWSKPEAQRFAIRNGEAARGRVVHFVITDQAGKVLTSVDAAPFYSLPGDIVADDLFEWACQLVGAMASLSRGERGIYTPRKKSSKKSSKRGGVRWTWRVQGFAPTRTKKLATIEKMIGNASDAETKKIAAAFSEWADKHIKKDKDGKVTFKA